MRKPYPVRESALSRKANGKFGSHVCVHCGKDASKEALFRKGNLTLIEKHCEDCLLAEKFTAIMTLYERTAN